MLAHKHFELFYPVTGSASHLGRQRSGTVSWFLRDWSGAHHPLSPVIKLGLRHPRKKETKSLSNCQSVRVSQINVSKNARVVKCKYLFHQCHFRLFKPKYATKEDHWGGVPSIK